MAGSTTNDLYGLVDMGSNGVRFSITDLCPATARSLPTVFQERLGLSLYDAQYKSGQKQPIPQDIINTVISALKRFKAVCADFEVSASNIRILATEATRNAINSEDYRKQIKNATGWTVDMLPKEAEGKVGASGVASSFEVVDGLVMDLGGGSTQLTWMISENGHVQTSPKGSFSFPYGAAALTQQLAGLNEQSDSSEAIKALQEKMRQQFVEAFEALDLPQSLHDKATRRGLTLYLSGGGFRGWGYLLMSRHKIKPYPIPIINGFHVPVKDFSNVENVKDVAGEKVFRVSKRRAQQVPAVAFLVGALIAAFPFISDVRFCQGGIREGFLFDTLAPHIRALSPLTSSTAIYSSCPESSAHIAALLLSALPGDNDLDRSYPLTITSTLLRAVANTMYVQSKSIKETASASALYLPIAGVLSSAHGVSHSDRAILSLILCQRWDGDLPPPDDSLQARLQGIVSQQEVWWSNYLGSIANLIGSLYPAGRVPDLTRPRIKLSARWSGGLGKKANLQGIVLTITISKDEGVMGYEDILEVADRIEAVGRKKNRVGGRDYGFGVPIRCDLDWVE